jgi:hypothetical protein
MVTLSRERFEGVVQDCPAQVLSLHALLVPKSTNTGTLKSDCQQQVLSLLALLVQKYKD